MKMTTHDLVLCALCAAVTCILAPLSVPLAGEVPISLATFAVLLSGILLGAKLGGLSQFIYVLLGSVGVPVFAGWKGGIGITLGITGGYIIGYIPMAFVAGLLYYRFGRNDKVGEEHLVYRLGDDKKTVETILGKGYDYGNYSFYKNSYQAGDEMGHYYQVVEYKDNLVQRVYILFKEI